MHSETKGNPFCDTFNDTQSFPAGYDRGLRAKAKLRHGPCDYEEDSRRSVRWQTVMYLLERLEVVPPVSRENGIAVAQLAMAYTNDRLVPQ